MNDIEIYGPDGQNTEPTKLGQDRQEQYVGDFVHDNQSMGAEAGFRNVSQTWLDNGCKSFDDVLNELAEGERHRLDVVTKANNWEAFRADDRSQLVGGQVDIHGRVVVESQATPCLKLRRRDTGQEYTPTPHALRQLASWLHLSTGTIRDALDPVYSGNTKENVLWPVSGRAVEDLARLMNHRLDLLEEPKGGDRELMFRVWTDNNTLRSIHSKKYARINNSWYVELLQKLIPDGRLSHWRGDRDNLYGNILIPDNIRQEDDSDYGGMISVGNSEIGMRQLYGTPSVFRSICMNGCIWDQEIGHTLKVRHVGNIDLNDLALRMKENLNAQIPLLDVNIDRMLSTRNRTTGGVGMKNIFAAICKDFGTSKSENAGILKAFAVEQDILNGQANTAFGVTQALTRYGQELDNESWVRFDELGGRMVTLSDQKWGAIVKRAESYNKEDLEKILGLPALSVSI